MESSPQTPPEVIMTNKEKVGSFIAAVNQADANTVTELVHPDYIQHNPFIPSGRDQFIGLFPVLEEYGTQATTHRMLQDGNYVVMHNLWTGATPFGAEQMVSFDLLRIDDDGLIAEHWDALMPLSAPNASSRTLLDGPTEVTDLDKTEENKAKVVELYDQLINGKAEELGKVLPEYFAADYHQHNPNAADGIVGLAGALQNGDLVFTFEQQHLVIGEGNFVLSISAGTHREQPAVFYDLLRFEEGLIVEHWDVIQDIPTENLANTNTMFGF